MAGVHIGRPVPLQILLCGYSIVLQGLGQLWDAVGDGQDIEVQQVSIDIGEGVAAGDEDLVFRRSR